MSRRTALVAAGSFAVGFLTKGLVDFPDKQEDQPQMNEFHLLSGRQKIARLLSYIDRTDDISLKSDGYKLGAFIEDETFYYGGYKGGFMRNPFEVQFFGGFPDLNHSGWRIGLVNATKIYSAPELAIFLDQAINVMEDGESTNRDDLSAFEQERSKHEIKAWELTLRYVYEPLMDKIKSKKLERLYSSFMESESLSGKEKALRRLQEDLGR